MVDKHTKGAWKAAEHPTYGHIVTAGEADNPDDLVAMGLQGEEDARLIAATPEMLEALRKISCPHVTKKPLWWQQCARAVLAKIDGQQVEGEE